MTREWFTGVERGSLLYIYDVAERLGGYSILSN